MTITWKETTEERYDEMLGVLPPAFMNGDGFLVGEPWNHSACTITGRIAPTYDAFMRIGEKFYNSTRPLTKAEFKSVKLADVVA